MSNASESHSARNPYPTAPRPLSPDYTDHTDPGAIWGHCRPYCIASDLPEIAGLSVDEHGDHCRSVSTIYVRAAEGATGLPMGISTHVVRPYLHGVYEVEERQSAWRTDDTIELSLYAETGSGDESAVRMTVGDARRLAAGLLKAAEAADLLDRDVNGATAERRADAM